MAFKIIQCKARIVGNSWLLPAMGNAAMDDFGPTDAVHELLRGSLEPLIDSGRVAVAFKIIQFKARIVGEQASPAVGNAAMDDFGPTDAVHELLRGSLEPLIDSGRVAVAFKIIQFKARIVGEQASPAVGNAAMDDFGPTDAVHELLRGSLVNAFSIKRFLTSDYLTLTPLSADTEN